MRRIRIVGVEETLRRLDGNTLIAEPWTNALKQAAAMTRDETKRRAPFRRGQLQGSIIYKLQQRPVPMWAIITAHAMWSGFRYGFVLDAGKARRRSGTIVRFRFRSGPQAGKSTRGWFRKVLPDMQPQIDALLRRAMDEVEQRWQSSGIGGLIRRIAA